MQKFCCGRGGWSLRGVDIAVTKLESAADIQGKMILGFDISGEVNNVTLTLKSKSRPLVLIDLLPRQALYSRMRSDRRSDCLAGGWTGEACPLRSPFRICKSKRLLQQPMFGGRRGGGESKNRRSTYRLAAFADMHRMALLDVSGKCTALLIRFAVVA